MIKDTAFTLSLIRHGQSEVNAIPDLMGQTADVPLTEKGKDQATRLRIRFLRTKEKFNYIYSSPYLRAYDTALLSIPDPRQTITLAPPLREYDAGDWLFGSRLKLITPQIKAKMDALNHTFLPPNGESVSMVERRASKWLEDEILYRQDAPYQGEPVNIACFSHGLTIKALLHSIIGFDKSFTWKIKIDNTSITKLSFDTQAGWKLLCINDCGHLES